MIMQNSFYQDIELLIKALKGAYNVTILTHSNADPDALSAACALHQAVARTNVEKKVEVLIPEGVGAESKALLDLCRDSGTSIEIVRRGMRLESKNRDLCVLVDTASFEQLKWLKEVLRECKTVAVIDHHYHQDLGSLSRGSEPNLILVVEPSATSACELVYLVLERLGVNIDASMASLLLAGILWDTRRFMRANPTSFLIAARLLECGANYNSIIKLLEVERPSHNRVARIKCLLRHRGFRVAVGDKDLYVAFSEVGAFESDCANMLVNAGYDIALVATEDEALKCLRVVYRAREEVVDALGLNVYEALLKPAITTFGGGGGGHKAAGGAVVKVLDINSLLKIFMEALSRISRGRVSEFSERRVGGD